MVPRDKIDWEAWRKTGTVQGFSLRVRRPVVRRKDPNVEVGGQSELLFLSLYNQQIHNYIIKVYITRVCLCNLKVCHPRCVKSITQCI